MDKVAMYKNQIEKTSSISDVFNKAKIMWRDPRVKNIAIASGIGAVTGIDKGYKDAKRESVKDVFMRKDKEERKGKVVNYDKPWFRLNEEEKEELQERLPSKVLKSSLVNAIGVGVVTAFTNPMWPTRLVNIFKNPSINKKYIYTGAGIGAGVGALTGVNNARKLGIQDVVDEKREMGEKARVNPDKSWAKLNEKEKEYALKRLPHEALKGATGYGLLGGKIGLSYSIFDNYKDHAEGKSRSYTSETYSKSDFKKEFDTDLSGIKTKAEFNKTYRNLAKKYHPDVNKSPGAEEKCKKLNNMVDSLRKSSWFEKLAKLRLSRMNKTAIYKQSQEKETINDILKQIGIHDSMQKGMLIGTATGIPIGVYDIFKNKDKFKDFTKWQKAKHVTYKGGKYGALGIGAGALCGLLKNVVKSKNLNKEASLVSKLIQNTYKINKLREKAMPANDIKKKEADNVSVKFYKDAIYKEANIGAMALKAGRAMVSGVRGLAGKAKTKFTPTSGAVKDRLGGVSGSVKQKGLSAQNNIPDRLQGLQTKRSVQEMAQQGYEMRRSPQLNRAVGKSTPLTKRLEQAKTQAPARQDPVPKAGPSVQPSQPMQQSVPVQKSDPWWKPGRVNSAMLGAGAGYGLGNLGKGPADKNIYREASGTNQYRKAIYKLAEEEKKDKKISLGKGALVGAGIGAGSGALGGVLTGAKGAKSYNEYLKMMEFADDFMPFKLRKASIPASALKSGAIAAGVLGLGGAGTGALTQVVRQHNKKNQLQEEVLKRQLAEKSASGMNQYKKAIQKLAEVTPVYRANKLHDLMEGFVDFDDAGTPEMRSYFERDVRNYVEGHPLFNQYVEDEAFNEERHKTKHPHGGKALVGAVAGSAIGSAVLSNLQGAKAVLQNAGARGAALKAFARGVNPGAVGMGALVGAGIGGIGKIMMDERHRRNIHGPMRDDTWDVMEKLPGSKMKDLIRENLSAADYSKVMSDKKMADAANAAALVYKQKAIHDMINSSTKKEASTMNEELYKEAKVRAVWNAIRDAGKAEKLVGGVRGLKAHGLKEKDAWKQVARGAAETGGLYGTLGAGAYGATKLRKKKKKEDEDKEANYTNEELYKEAKFEAVKKFFMRGPKNVAEGGRKILQAGKDYNVAKTPQTQGLAYAKLKKGGKALGKGVAETSAVYGGVPVGAYGAYKIFKKKDTEQDKAANEAYKDAIYKEAKEYSELDPSEKKKKRAVSTGLGAAMGAGAGFANPAIMRGVGKLVKKHPKLRFLDIGPNYGNPYSTAALTGLGGAIGGYIDGGKMWHDAKEKRKAKEANYTNEELYKEARIGAIVKGVSDFAKNRWKGQGIGTGAKKMYAAGKDYMSAKTPQTKGLALYKAKKGAKEFGKGAVIPGTAGLATGATVHGLRKKKREED